MTTTIEQQTALDESLIPSTQRLRIGRSNFRLPSDIQSKEATLQVVYDVLRNSPLFRAFQVTADVPEIYMQEFLATTKLHHNSIRFKIDTRKSVLDLEAFREMLHISPRIPNQPFADLPTEEEILDFLRFLGHSHDIRYLTDVNVNKIYQPWRSFASVINKCLTSKSSGVDSFRLSQAQMLWGFYYRINIDFAYLIWEDFVIGITFEMMLCSQLLSKAYKEYHACAMGEAAPKPKASARKKKGDSASSTTPTPTTTIESTPRLFRLSQAQMLWGFYYRINIDFAYLIREDFVYQVEHKNQKRSNEMNYPRFMKVIIDYFMTRKPSISRRNRINWHYVRDDALFSTIKVVSRHQTTQQYGVILPIELTTDEIKNSKAYKEYYAYAMGAAAPKPKASTKKKKGESASSTTPPTPTPTTTVESAPRLYVIAKGKQPSRATTPIELTYEGTGSKPGVPDAPSDDSEEELSWNSSDDEDVGGHEEGNKSDESDDDRDEGSDDDSDETVKAGSGKNYDDDDNEDDDDNDEKEELAKDDDEVTETGKGGDEVRESKGESEEEEEIRQEEEESFDLIPKTHKE
nr:hypothetical protein [Tanacetum cinerariifolium]